MSNTETNQVTTEEFIKSWNEGIEFLRKVEVKEKNYDVILGYSAYLNFIFDLYPKKIALRILKRDCRKTRRSKIKNIFSSYKINWRDAHILRR
jgi:hypothetical protein